MSVNHLLSSEIQEPSSLWRRHRQYNIMESSSSSSKKTVAGFDLNDDEEERDDVVDVGGGDDDSKVVEVVPKEHLFEKPLTPSDVGKLNRLVIPKQHAERYFPLTGQDSAGGGGGVGGAGGEKGFLLTFEDESFKIWRFRYSYWNSSQSYVLTKGWSRFVKEKRLDAGDVVLFLRHRLDSNRLFIGWRRRNNAGDSTAAREVAPPNTVVSGGGGGNNGWGQVYYSYPPAAAAAPAYQTEYLYAGSSIAQSQTQSSGSSKTLRLFGVDMECQQPDEAEPAGSSGSSGSSQGQTGHHYLYQYYSAPHATYNNYYSNTQDLNFSRDVNQMRYHQG